MIVIVFGLPGSGKTYFARHVTAMLHAEYIGSDVVRRELFEKPSYSFEEKKYVYSVMLKRVRDKADFKEVVIDATFFDVEIRQIFITQAQRISIVYLIEVWADENLIEQRLSLRNNDSYANFDVYKKLKTEWKFLNDKHLVLNSTNNNIIEMLDHTTDFLFAQNEKRMY